MKTISKLILLSTIVQAMSCGGVEKAEGVKENEIDEEVSELTLCDASATAKTRALYANLWKIQQKGFMFGHHDDLMYGRYWYNEPGRSDTKDVCGDYPAVYSLDLAEMSDDRRESSADENAIRMRCIKEAYDRGIVITACWHINNPLTGGDSWDNSNNKVVSSILEEGSETNLKFKGWLDNLAEAVLDMKGSDGELIPIIFRPFHEHTQTWSWWGSSCTTTEEYVALWKYVITYLRDTKGVHNLIYAISPQMDSAKTVEDFYFRWPGDNWVDFVGMDCYQGINNSVFVNNLKAISKVSADKRKPCGVTETGVEGFKTIDYWTVNIHAPMTGRRVSMVVTWRNKFVGANESDKHFFSVYKGHPSEADFVKMYNQGNTFFCKDLPDMYSMPSGMTVR
jgi:mannan endo-1,4-beta-mannosidase